jgi:ATP-dependent Clp protease ATP-binding subunit ClpA
VPLTEDSKQVLHLAMEESEKLGMRHVGTEHILLALLSVETSLAAQLLHARGLTAAEVRAHLSKSPQSTSVSLQALQNDKGKLMLESFLSGLKSENAEELIEFFSQNAQSIDIFGKRWNREEMFENFATLFAPYAKKNATFLVEKTIADDSNLFVASVLWRNAILASMQRIWMHRMTVVLTREGENWSILLLHVTAIQPE